MFFARYSNGDSFKGTFVQGARCGPGEYRAAGLLYVGEWAEDDANGKVRENAFSSFPPPTNLFFCCG